MRVLHLEDNALDAELVRNALELQGVNCKVDRVVSRSDFEQALQAGSYDLILSDFSMPGFDGARALALAQTLTPQVPFVFVSGTIGEERAVESLRNGAVDYVLKDRLQRLGSAVNRARRDAVAQAEHERTQRRLAEQAELLNRTRDAIFVCDLGHRVTYWNAGAEQLYGWKAEEVLGKRASEFLSRPGSSVTEEFPESVFEKGDWVGEFAQATAKGKEIWVISRQTLLRDASGQSAAILTINTDITEKKALESQVLRSQRMDSIGALAGGIAHDLNNVLAPILMATELMEISVHDESSRRMLEVSKTSAQRGVELVQQILQYAKGGKSRLGPINFGVLIEDIVKMARHTFPQRISVQTDLAANLSSVLGDSSQIHQVLLNLCVNARDALPPEGGTITISARNVLLKDRRFECLHKPASGEFVEICVTDTGSGIPEHILPEIFEPFFTTKAEDKGTGLGLSTVLTILRNHNGAIEVTSESGKGSAFSIYLPVVKSVAEIAPAPPVAEAIGGNGEWILLIDQEQALLEMNKEILTAHNYCVLPAASASAALTCLGENFEKLKAVVIDLSSTGGDSRKFILTIKELAPEIGIIGVTGDIAGYSACSEQMEAITLVRKPCSATDLLLALKAKLRSAAFV